MSTQKFNINWRNAIGEFLIVVIGIITAFQVDAWKENRDNQGLLMEYLTDLEVGLRTDSMYFGNSAAYFKNIGLQIDSTQDFLKEGVRNLPPSGQKSIRKLTDWYHIYITNAAFEDLNNSGRLNLIRDKRLRYDLIAYYQYIDFVKLLDEEYNQSLGRMQETLLMRLDLQDPESLKVSASDVPIIMNFLNQKEYYMRNYLSHRSICQSINDSIRKQIKAIREAKNK